MRGTNASERVWLDSFLNELLQKFHEFGIGSKPEVTQDGGSETLSTLRSSPKCHQELHRWSPKTLRPVVGDYRKVERSTNEVTRKQGYAWCQHLLRHSFEWGPFERNYNVGDEMFEPNLYCWQPICYVLSNLGVILKLKPSDLNELEQIGQRFKKHNESISRTVHWES